MNDPQRSIRLWLQEQLDGRPHGTKGRLAVYLGVRPDAITRMANTDPNKETREIRAHEHEKMREFFSALEKDETLPDESEVAVRQPRSELEVVWVNELDVRAAAGFDVSTLEIDSSTEQQFVVGRYAFPARAFEETFGSSPGNVRICNIKGNSMVPDLLPGQRVMVDLDDRVPSPPGTFFVYDGLGIVCKLVEYIPHSEPARVRIFSRNSTYEPYERNLDEAYICGRVIGVWQRT